MMSPAAEFVDIGPVERLPIGGRLDLVVNYVGVALFNLDGVIYALEDVCTHDGGPLGEGEVVNGCEVECPRHGARFDIRTGEVTRGPAFQPTTTYAVRVEDGRILVEKPI